MGLSLKIVGAALAGGLAFGVAGAATAKEYVFGMFLPPKHEANVLGMEPYFEKLKKETGGKVAWSLLAGGQLFSGKATLSSVGKGIADGGLAVFSYTQSDLKHAYVMTDLHMLGSDPHAANAAVLQTLFFDCPECLADFTGNNVVPIGGYSPGIYRLVCAKPVKGLEDMKGLKVRTTGATGRWVEAIGAVPTNMSSDEVPEAMRRGLVDCYAGPMAWMDTYKLYDIVKAALDVPMGIFKGGAFVINRDTWKALPDADKRTMLKLMPETVARISVEGYSMLDDKARETAAKRGIAVGDGGPALAKLLKEHIGKELKVVVDLAEKRGVKNGQQIVDTYIRNLDAWEALMAKTDGSTDAYAKLLWERIYSKIDPAKL